METAVLAFGVYLFSLRTDTSAILRFPLVEGLLVNYTVLPVPVMTSARAWSHPDTVFQVHIIALQGGPCLSCSPFKTVSKRRASHTRLGSAGCWPPGQDSDHMRLHTLLNSCCGLQVKIWMRRAGYWCAVDGYAAVDRVNKAWRIQAPHLLGAHIMPSSAMLRSCWRATPLMSRPD